MTNHAIVAGRCLVGVGEGPVVMLMLERETGFEPATNGLEGRDSTPELLPLGRVVEAGGFEPP